MKPHNFFYLSLVTTLLLLLNISSIAFSQNKQPIWIRFGSTPELDAFYDKNSLNLNPAGNVTLMIRADYTDAGSKNVSQKFNINTPTKYQIAVVEIDCDTSSIRFTSEIYFSEQWNVLNDLSRPDRPMQPIKQKTNISVLAANACTFKSMYLAKASQPQAKERKAAPKETNKNSSSSVLDKYN